MYRRAIIVFLALMVFASVSSALPYNLTISIDGGANYSTNETVSLTLSAENTTGSTNCSYANVVTSWSGPEAYSTSKTWNLSSGDGLKTVYYKCTDDGENWSEVESDQITLDTNVPLISSLSPGNDSIATSLTPTISAALSDSGSGINESSIELKFNGSVVNATYSAGTVSYELPSNLSETNYYSAQLSVEDNSGQSSFVSWNFTVDLIPVIGEINPDSNDYIKSTSFKIYAQISDSGSGINYSAIVLKVDGSEVTPNWQAGEVEYSADVNEGEVDVELTVYDNNGNAAFKNWSFIVDNTEPTITNLNPTDKSTISSISSISAKIDDEHAGVDEESILFKVDNVDITSSATFSGGILSYSAIGLGGGSHSAEIWVDDEAGNDAFKYWTFSVVATVPTIDQMTPSQSTNDATPKISARLTDSGSSGLNLATMRIYVDDADVSSKAKYDSSKRTISYTPTSDLSEGSHSVKVEVSDYNGNRGSKSWTFTVDKSAPGSPTNLEATVVGSAATLSWTKVSGATKYNVYRSGTKILSVSGLSARSTVTTNSYSDQSASGNWYYAVTALDSTGNEGAPAFVGTCAEYGGSGWVDYDCCKDDDCPFGNCNLTTNTCYTPKVDTTKSDAESAIDAAKSAIQSANESGVNITDAQMLLNSAESAFKVGNYAQAKNYANQAASAVQSNQTGNETGDGETETDKGKKRLPCCPGAFILFAVAGLGLYYSGFQF
jgi:hypothetical protein